MFVQLALCFGGPTVAQAGGKDPLAPGPVRPGNLDYRTELPKGYLKVYSATDEFKDGDVRYFPHSSYAIYTTGGKLFKNVKNQRSAGDEVPEMEDRPRALRDLLRAERAAGDSQRHVAHLQPLAATAIQATCAG